jgi:pimeloyl-ACP methyl ester carboxylesterase
LEVWVRGAGAQSADKAELFVLKFGGAGGRAERATDHPLDYWTDLPAELWTVNPPGYGGSSGKARLRKMAAAARAAHDEMAAVAEHRPVVVVGNSLGTATALYLGAACGVGGLILRNPPPLREMIVGRHGWWNLRIGARLIARQVPLELDSVRNARRCRVPAVFVTSGADRVVPPCYQEKIIDAYAGEKCILRRENADHTTPLQPEQAHQYGHLLQWLRDRVLA